MTSRVLLTCSLASAAFGCTIGTPFGSTSSSYYGPPQPRPTRSAPVETAADDVAPEAPRGRLACVRDDAGVDFASATQVGKGTVRGDADNRGAILREAVQLRAGTYYVQVEEAGWGIGYGNGPAGSDSHQAKQPTGHFTKPYTIEIMSKGDATKKRVSKR
jgi:hypothetical protein